MCGGAPTIQSLTFSQAGLSPRVRGSRRAPVEIAALRGSIPACAGEPLRKSLGHTATWVYPRVCGGAFINCAGMSTARGLSPRVRGSPHEHGRTHGAAGSIPACAGEPHRKSARPRCRRVYPRVCGGAPPSTVGDAVTIIGSIPACAGEPLLFFCHSRTRNEHPGSIPACAGEPADRICSPVT